jgi:hypothetical protein
MPQHLPGVWSARRGGCLHHPNADRFRRARRLVSWCGLAWEPVCLAFHQNRRPVRTASVRQVRQPIYEQSEGPLAPFVSYRKLFN